MNNKIQNIVIVGGGTAGWMTAAALGKLLNQSFGQITLIESEDIPTVGVGEATIPQIQVFNDTLGINEDDFIKHTQGTFKLGIEFVNWGKIGDSYIHAFGGVGHDMDALPFYQYWWKLRQQNKAEPIGAYSLNAVACQYDKFMRSIDAGNSPLSNIAYAFQFDAGLYAQYLRQFAQQHGVTRNQNKVVKTHLRPENGFIKSVELENGEQISADLFIDCSGFQGLLIEQALNTGYTSWRHWLPCDSAWAVPCERSETLKPYTRATAHSAGWQWQIPLQHRTGNGHVYSSRFISDEEAKQVLLDNLPGKALGEPRLLRFNTGKRNKIWHKNCVAIGLSSGFLEPLESTSIHLIQSTIARLMAFFPDKSFNAEDITMFNQQMDFEYERIRDFIILHYKATQRDDSNFWNYCRMMDIPETLQQKMSQFLENGNIVRDNLELFNDTSWLEVLHGQNLTPKRYHPLVDAVPQDELERRVAHIQSVITNSVDTMPNHQQFINQHCKAPS